MSEHALKPQFATPGIDSSGIRRVEFQESAIGNAVPDTGKKLPREKAENVDLQALTQELNVVSRSIGREIRFEVNLDNGPTVIQVLDRETGEVIRQIPPEKASIDIKANGKLALRLIDAVV